MSIPREDERKRLRRGNRLAVIDLVFTMARMRLARIGRVRILKVFAPEFQREI